MHDTNDVITVGIPEFHLRVAPNFGEVVTPNYRYVKERYAHWGVLSRFGWMKSIKPITNFVRTTNSPDLLHTYNTLVLNKQPWIVTFESLLPRTYSHTLFGNYLFSVLARDHCRQVIAISENAKKHMHLRNRAHSAISHVLDKTRVVYPAIKDFPEFYQSNMERPRNDRLNLLFVGGDYFWKGGFLAVNAYERLKDKYPIDMTVISWFRRSTIEARRKLTASAGTQDEAKKKMASLGIRYIERLDYQDLRELMGTMDFQVMPTLDDSFGYSVVEGMASGVVPIVPKIRAMPEMMEHGREGYLVDAPVDAEGRIDFSRTDLKTIEDNLVTTLEEALTNSHQLEQLKLATRQRYEKQFTQDRLGRELNEIYQRACPR